MRIRRTSRQHADGHSCPGYTLVEMLIASVLVAALMSVVWGMLSMYNSYLTAGQKQAQEQQLARSVMQLLAEDLQSVALPDSRMPIVGASLVSGAATGESWNPQNDVPAMEPARPADGAADPVSGVLPEVSSDASSLGPSGDLVGMPVLVVPGRVALRGSRTGMRLDVETASPETPPDTGLVPATANAAGTIQETAVIPETAAWPLADTGVAVGENVEVAEMDETAGSAENIAPAVPQYQTVIWRFQPPGQMASGSSWQQSGLTRLQVDTQALQAASMVQDATPDAQEVGDSAFIGRLTLETLLQPPTAVGNSGGRPGPETAGESGAALPAVDIEVIPEVVSCQFEYFSGTNWSGTWDSDIQGLPAAVRIHLTLVRTSDFGKWNDLVGAAGSNEPLPGEESTVAAESPAEVELPESAGETLPLASIPMREYQRIVVLQPVTGSMPQPGLTGDSSGLTGDAGGQADAGFNESQGAEP